MNFDTSTIKKSRVNKMSMSGPVHTTQVFSNNVVSKAGLFVWSLSAQVFVLLLVAILSFGIGLQYWNHKMLFENEVRLADDKHLVTAAHLALSLSRYSRDVSLVFSHWAKSVANADTASVATAEHIYLTKSMDLDGFAILSRDDTVENRHSLIGLQLALPDEKVLEGLRVGTNDLLHGVQISDLQRIGDARYFILGFNLQNDRLAIGYLNINYIKEVQNRIKFGKLGHAAIFDASGHAVAHPILAVEEKMMDASGLSIVKRMMNGETGVDRFCSPPMNADMIAGFTFVPETGWPVMVPQPIQELSDSVETSLHRTNFVILAVSVVLALFGWLMTRALVRPISRFTAASLKIAEGDYAVDLPDRERSSLEMWRLNEALKVMVRQISTSKKRLQAAFEIEALESKNKSEFLIIASHELRSPLSGVVGMLSACREQAEDGEMAAYLDIASQSAMQLNSIVDEMTLFAEEQSSSRHTNLMSINVGQELSQLAITYTLQAKAAGLEFNYIPQPGLDRDVITDRHLVFHIVGNLIENAIKYTRNGSVSLGVSLETETGTNDSWLNISVKDTGMGIDSTNLECIFDPFYQIDRSYSRSHNGLGIGLTIVKSMLNRLEGQIHCQSEVDKGSEFRLRIPVQTVKLNGHFA
jgi:signal transduction histidine kinase